MGQALSVGRTCYDAIPSPKSSAKPQRDSDGWFHSRDKRMQLQSFIDTSQIPPVVVRDPNGSRSVMTGSRFRFAVKTVGHAATSRLRRWMSRLRCTLAAVLMASCGVVPLAAQTPADIARATNDLARSLDLQIEFPSDKPEETEWPGDLNIDIVRVLLWIAVIAGVGVLAYFAYDVLPTFGLAGRTRWDDHADGAGISESGVNEATRLAADELAAQGRFVEAMHVLLLQGLDEMRVRLDLRFADSLTSREIVSRSNAPADAKAALREIIQRVERAYFGDYPADRTGYDACRRSFLALGSALGAGGCE
jgi:Domain of unknown function (DUF4129)